METILEEVDGMTALVDLHAKWNGLTILIVGAARQGLALAAYLARKGARVVLNDQRTEGELASARASLAEDLGSFSSRVSWACGGHSLDLLAGVDLVCVSGGVPLDLPLIAEAIRLGLSLSNDSQIFLEAVPCPVVGITGSAGKTTTTTLVGRIAEASGRYRKVWVGGNIGLPLINLVDQMTADDLVVMELSSFQLEIMTCSPQVAVVLNITPNHLDRHSTMENYTAAKAHVLDYQLNQDLAILGRDDPGSSGLIDRVKGRLLTFGLSPLASTAEGVELIGDTIYFRRPGNSDRAIMDRAKIQLRGEHNLLNVMAACAIAAGLHLPIEAILAGVEGFGGVSHRLELVRRWRGAAWYNDSIATAPERAMAAIRSFSEPLIVLAGGRDKKLPWEDFVRLVYQRVDHLVVFGEAASLIEQACQQVSPEFQNQPGLRLQADPLTITRCPNLFQAVRAAADLANTGDVVLLSPGGTSFDEFRDFEERGQCFAQWVKELD